MPYSKTLERETMPTVEKIIQAVLETLGLIS
jgi:pyruvate/2-oxoglutarate/acetoin dehydrogenase E1 component